MTLNETTRRQQLDRRLFVRMGLAGASMSIASLVPDALADPAVSGGDHSADEVNAWADAVSSASVATNLYTDLALPELGEAVNAYRCECMFATVNEDGTPNLAIFTGGGMIDETYAVFNWYENQTYANVRRTKLGMIGYDVVDLDADTKEGRHQGAIVKVELVEDEAVREELAAEYAFVLPETAIFKIVEVLPVG